MFSYSVPFKTKLLKDAVDFPWFDFILDNFFLDPFPSAFCPLCFIKLPYYFLKQFMTLVFHPFSVVGISILLCIVLRFSVQVLPTDPQFSLNPFNAGFVFCFLHSLIVGFISIRYQNCKVSTVLWGGKKDIFNLILSLTSQFQVQNIPKFLFEAFLI